MHSILIASKTPYCFPIATAGAYTLTIFFPSGYGGVLFCVYRGRLSEGINIGGCCGRAVIAVGVPFRPNVDTISVARCAVALRKHGLHKHTMETFDAIRASAQAVGRVVRGKDDYAIIYFFDDVFIYLFIYLFGWLVS